MGKRPPIERRIAQFVNTMKKFWIVNKMKLERGVPCYEKNHKDFYCIFDS